MIVDAHAHIYSPDETAYPTIESPYRPPAGKGTPELLRAEMNSAGVDRAMLIQTSTFYRWDNTFVRDVGASAGPWARTCVTLDPEDPHSPDVLFALHQRANARALRIHLVRDGSIAHTGNRRLWAAAYDLSMTVNLLVNEVLHADQAIGYIREFPRLNVVLDHCLSLSRGPDFEAKLRRAIELASFKNIHAKVTFLPTGSVEEYPFSDMHGALQSIVDAYGADRCIWGSDYPTELWCPRVTYRQHLRLFQEDLGLSAGQKEAVLGGTAWKLWFA